MYLADLLRKTASFASKNCSCALLALVLAINSSGQSTFGEFLGTVKDPSGAVISGCVVTVRNLGTSATRSTTTDEAGSYTVVNLEPGTYEITIEQQGFQKITHTNLQLLSRQTLRVDGALTLASQVQTVEVSVHRLWAIPGIIC